jgi:hypothetical protein
VESLYFTTNDEINKKYKGAEGGFRTWLTEGKVVDLPDFLTSEVSKTRKISVRVICMGFSNLAYTETGS